MFEEGAAVGDGGLLRGGLVVLEGLDCGLKVVAELVELGGEVKEVFGGGVRLRSHLRA